VARTATSSEAELIVGYLRSAGVRAEVEDVQIGSYDTTVGGQLRVIVPPESGERALELLREADHVDAADPGSDLDVGLPVDEDVRDYLKWKSAADVDQPAAGPVAVPIGVEEVHARRLPLVPLLGAIAFVVAVVVLLH